MKRIAVVAIVLGLTLLVVPSALAQVVIPPDSVAYGRTDAEWHAAWWQWPLSIPSNDHPMFDTADCSVGQTGPVWFLGGKFCNPAVPCTVTGVVRSCSVPYGKALYVGVLGDEDSALEESTAEDPGNETYQLITTLRSVDAAFVDATTSVFLSVDGKPVRDFMQRFPDGTNRAARPTALGREMRIWLQYA